MNPYNKHADCHKCAGTDIKTIYRAKGERCYGWSGPNASCGEYTRSIMERICQCCHHEWCELPLDECPAAT